MWGKKFIALLIILLIDFLGLIFLTFETHGLLFRLEILLLLIFLFVSFIIMLGLFVEESWAWALAFIFFAVYLFNLIFLKYFIPGHNILFGGSFVVGIIGFLMSIANLGKKEEELPYEDHEKDRKLSEYTEVPEVETYDIKPKAKRTAPKRSPKRKSKKRSKKR